MRGWERKRQSDNDASGHPRALSQWSLPSADFLGEGAEQERTLEGSLRGLSGALGAEARRRSDGLHFERWEPEIFDGGGKPASRGGGTFRCLRVLFCLALIPRESGSVAKAQHSLVGQASNWPLLPSSWVPSWAGVHPARRPERNSRGSAGEKKGGPLCLQYPVLFIKCLFFYRSLLEL